MGGKSKKVTKKDRAKFDKIDAMYKKGEGRWVTINGQHKFVADNRKK